MRDILLLQLGRLGDLIQTLPVIRRCKQAHPGCRVTLVCLENFRDAVRESGGWDRLIPVRLEDTDALAGPGNREAFPDRPPFDSIPEFRERYDLVLALNPDLGSAILCDRIAAARKLGRVDTMEGELRLLGPWAKYLFAMVGERTANLYNIVDVNMGLAGLAPARQEPCLPVSAPRLAEARDILRANGWRGGRPLVALQTGASDLHRAWDTDHFAALAARLADDGAEVALLGDARESDRTREVREKSGRPLIDLAGKTGLPLLAAAVKSCDLLVSNDTGTLHVAAGVGTPTLGLFFASAYFSETAPYGAGHAVLQVEIPCSPCSASSRCVRQICREHLSADAVHRTVRWLLRPGGEAPDLPPNLGLYRSRFLDNGTLLYAPVREERLSDHYLAGLLGRHLWDRVLGIPPDPFLGRLGLRARESAAWQGRREGQLSAIESLAGPLERGADLAGQLRRAFADGDAGAIRPLHSQILGLGGTVTAAGERGGMLGAYVRYEMMDLPYADYPDLAALLEEKYLSLSAWCGRVRDALRAA